MDSPTQVRPSVALSLPRFAFLTTFLLKLMTAFVGVARGVVLSRLLGPAGRGAFELLQSSSELGARWAVLGQDQTVCRYAGRDPELAPGLLRRCLRQVGGVGVLCALGLGGWAVSGWGPEFSWIRGLMLGLALPVLCAHQLVRSLVLGLKRIHAFGLSELGARALALLFALGLWAARVVDPTQAFLVTTVAPSLVALLFLVPSVAPLWRQRHALALPPFRETAGYGLRGFGVGWVGQFIADLNLFLCWAFLGAEGAGHFGLALRGSQSLGLLTLTFSQLLLPELSSRLGRGEDAGGVVVRSLLALALTGVCVALPFSWVMPDLVEFLYGREFLPSVGPAVILLGGAVFQGLASVLLAYFGALGMPRGVLYLGGVLLVFEWAVGSWAVQRSGVMGAAVALSLTQGLYFLGLGALALWTRKR